MAIRGKEEEKKNGMKITDNMDGESNAEKKLFASTIKEFSDAEIIELKRSGKIGSKKF